ncbi:MAG: SCO family protein [Planctomycetaceae bacterium]
MKRRSLGITCAVAAAAAGGWVALKPRGSEKVNPDRRYDPSPNRRRSRLQLPDVVLEDERGLQFRLVSDAISNRSVCVNFFYTQCDGSCPGTTRVLRQVRTQIATAFSPEELIFLSISLDPETDSPQRLAEYRKAYGIPVDPRIPEWRFCTCPAVELGLLRRAFGVYDPDPAVDQDKSQHAATLTFGNDRTGRWSALPSGMPTGQLLTTMCRVMGNTEHQRYAIAQRYREAALGNLGTSSANQQEVQANADQAKSRLSPPVI